MTNKSPKLRNVTKVGAPFLLNKFPTDFASIIGKELIYLLATRESHDLEGKDWERIFAKAIGAEWNPSNVGLDDIQLGNTAWGAKSVKHANPSSAKVIRLISGRNSLVYSYGEKIDTDVDPNTIGPMVLEIWNERVNSVRSKFKSLRTVVLVKGNDLGEVVVFEFDTDRYDPTRYRWEWNSRKNLKGFEKTTGQHVFTWQPHGSQFTIIEPVPTKRLLIRIKKPTLLNQDQTLKVIGFDSSWITQKWLE